MPRFSDKLTFKVTTMAWNCCQACREWHKPLAFGILVCFLILAMSILEEGRTCQDSTCYHLQDHAPLHWLTQLPKRTPPPTTAAPCSEPSSRKANPVPLLTEGNSPKSRGGIDNWNDRAFWKRLSRSPRSPNRCTSSSCPNSTAVSHSDQMSQSPPNTDEPNLACPFYFRYIHEDLMPWRDHGISKDVFKNATELASFRVVIKNGRLYAAAFETCYQTRALFSIWGLLQLLDYYPGAVPDVDLLFSCDDKPRVAKTRYSNVMGPPPPLFSYCSTPDNFDIPFPDWSFWGWPEIGLKPWDAELTDILKGQSARLWEHRRPYAFWKGNTATGGGLRKWLQACNGEKFGADIIHQDWKKEMISGFNQSMLSQQCKHRYKIYIEGRGWSVSLKYILTCDSPVLLVDPVYHDFYSRGLMPMEHFWPIRVKNMCKSIKFGVDYGNNNTMEAELMGRYGRQFVTRDVRMKLVYDYMLHIITEYSKLLRYKPDVEGLTELCPESLLCQAPESEMASYKSSRITEASGTPPCFLHRRDPHVVHQHSQRRADTTRLVHEAEDNVRKRRHLHIVSGP